MFSFGSVLSPSTKPHCGYSVQMPNGVGSVPNVMKTAGMVGIAFHEWEQPETSLKGNYLRVERIARISFSPRLTSRKLSEGEVRGKGSIAWTLAERPSALRRSRAPAIVNPSS